MPKGRMGISGPGQYRRVYLPKDGSSAQSPEEEKLVTLNELKVDLLEQIEKRIPRGTQLKNADDVWDNVLTAVGNYLGQAERGLPPTLGEMNQTIERISKLASKLDDELGNADFHIQDTIHKGMHRQGGDLYKLKTQLSKIIDIDVIAKAMHGKDGYLVSSSDPNSNKPGDISNSSRHFGPKARPDPYAEYLIRELFSIWRSATGTIPGKTGDSHGYHETGRTSRWCCQISEVIIGKPFPRDLIDTVIDLMSADG